MPQLIDILLVDDQKQNLDVLESILEDPSYRLLRADSADLALKLLLEQNVAAIVLDIKMPGMSGIEFASLIKGTKRFRDIPIVFLTAYLVNEEDVLAGYGAGAVDYLTKPVTPSILRRKVAVFVDLFRKTRALAELNEQLEARVQERTAELEDANRMKDQFLATLSHELRTPLNAILGWAEILHKDPADPAKVRRGLEVISRNASAQERMVTDLLDVSRIVSGKLRLKMKKFHLSTAVRAAVDIVRPAADAKDIRLVLDIDPHVDMTIGDPQRLQQALSNLLVNAIRYTARGGRVAVAARRVGSDDVVRVEDTGMGIAPDQLDHIFERFHQVDSSTTRAHGGLGLGLPLVRYLVEAHGGTTKASSQGLGRGATFTLTLPVRAVDLAGADAANDIDGAQRDDAEGEPVSADGSLRRQAQLADVRALVVEDDVDSLDLLRIALEEAGASVTSASSAAEALEALETEPHGFDVLVSDIGMPGTDGYTLMRRIRSEKRALPAVAVTAFVRGDDVIRAERAGFQRHLSKPVDSRTLVETVRQLVCAHSSSNAAS